MSNHSNDIVVRDLTIKAEKVTAFNADESNGKNIGTRPEDQVGKADEIGELPPKGSCPDCL